MSNRTYTIDKFTVDELSTIDILTEKTLTSRLFINIRIYVYQTKKVSEISMKMRYCLKTKEFENIEITVYRDYSDSDTLFVEEVKAYLVENIVKILTNKISVFTYDEVCKQISDTKVMTTNLGCGYIYPHIK